VNEVVVALARMKAAYPRFPMDDATIQAYIWGLEDLPAPDVARAVLTAILTATFPPSIAELRDFVAEEILGLPGPAAALVLVQDAAQGRIEYRTLPEVVKQTLRACGGMFDWKNTTKPDNLRRLFLSFYAEFRKAAIEGVTRGQIDSGRDMKAIGKGDE
jgi:hypothetical protein